jgi:hypothetical protein
MEMKILEELELFLQSKNNSLDPKEVNKFLQTYIENETFESVSATDIIKMHNVCRKYEHDMHGLPNYKEIYKFYMHIIALDYIKHRGPN